MIGAILNAIGILAGGTAGLVKRQPIAAQRQVGLKSIVSLLTVATGLYLTWTSVTGLSELRGGFGGFFKHLAILVLALMFGRLTGRLLMLQKTSNWIGQHARSILENPNQPGRRRFDDGLLVGTLLFCAAPLAVLGAVQDGLNGWWYVLGVKAIIDGLTAMSFAQMFGWSPLLSALPVLAFEGTITLLVRWWAGPSPDLAIMLATQGTCGLLVFSTAMLLLNLRRIEVADYLPSLVYAPLLAWLWR